MTPIRSIPLLLIAATSSAQSAREPVMRVLIDRELNQRLAEVVSLDSESVTIRHIDGEALRIDRDELVAVVPASRWHNRTEDPTLQTRGALSTRSGTMTLTDGQRLTGAPSAVRVDGDFVAWNNQRLGLITAPIELVSHLSMPRSIATGMLPPRLGPEIDDVVLLTNGDSLRGFVESIGIETAIELQSGTVIEAETSRVDQITLANEPTEPMGMRIWLADGSVLAVSDLESEVSEEKTTVMAALTDRPIAAALGSRDPSEAEAIPVGLQMSFALSELSALSFDPRLLVPLSSIEADTVGRELLADTGGFAALSCFDIDMPGPMRSTWPLPRNADQLSLTATLPMQARAWGDLELIVRTDGDEVQRHAINAASPIVRVQLDISGSQTFSLEITEGSFGPVQDRLVLSQGLVLIGD